MFVADDRVIYSASDLAAAARCEYALLRSFDAQLGWGPPVAVEDELLARTAKLGGEQEQRHLDELRGDESVAIIGRPPYTVDGLTAAAEQTMRAVERRAPVIYQAAMFDGRFIGFADFLVREHSRDVTTNWAVPKRAGKVFMDQNQNARFKSLAAPYSPRAKPGAPVSMPLRWDELGDAYPSDFTMSRIAPPPW